MVFFICCVQCTTDELSSVSSERLSLYGNTYAPFVTSAAVGRTTSEELAEDSQMSLYASGGIVCDGQLFTWHDQQWESAGNPLRWLQRTDAQLHAYTPPLCSDTTRFYDDRQQLIDRLHCLQTLPYSAEAVLHFSHLFARLQVQVEESLNDAIEQVRITPSVRVAGIRPSDGCLDLSTEALPTVTFARQAERVYSILVPYDHPITLRLEVTTRQGAILYGTTTPALFESGHHYTCTLSCGKSLAGIYTTEDFIAFSHLINGDSYDGRSLAEFGSTDSEGKTTYRLWKDLSFTAEESARIQMIGNNSRAFSACFDGQGHRLSGLRLTNTAGYAYAGVFGTLNSAGSIRQLTLEDCQIAFENDAQNWVGILCGGNNGIIDGCRIINCSLATSSSRYAGGIAGINMNIVRNCGVETSTLTNTSSKEQPVIGGIAGMNHHDIHNCYAASNTLSAIRMGGICFGAVNQNYPHSVKYVYVYNTTCPTEGTGTFAPIIFTTYDTATTLRYCFHDTGTVLNDATHLIYTYKYRDDFMYNQKRIDQWVNNATSDNRSLYPAWEKTTDPQVPFRLAMP